VIKTQKNETLKTDEITWKIDKKIITTDKPVELETPKEKLYGTGMDANQDFTQYTLRNPRGTVQVDNFPQ
jgi:LPS export ABC transporter protein LptC